MSMKPALALKAVAVTQDPEEEDRAEAGRAEADPEEEDRAEGDAFSKRHSDIRTVVIISSI